MNRSKLFIWLSAATGYTAFGIFISHFIGNNTSTLPLWIAAFLAALSALTLGMYISAKPSDAALTTPSPSDTSLPSEER
jgi:hypothetical protein